MAELLISGGLVLTAEPDVLTGAIIPDGAVLVRDNLIAEIGTRAELAAKHPRVKRLDASGRLVMPGFIITHTHMPYVLGHNQPVDFSQLKSFWDMLQKMGWEWLEDITTAEGIYAGTRYAAAKMLKAGTTTVCDLVEGPNALPGALEASAKAIEEVGIRAQLGFEVTERIPGVSILERLDPGMAEKGFEENLRLLARYPAGGPQRIQGRLGVHTAFTNSYATLKKARKIADEQRCGIQIHVAEIPRAFLVEKYGKSAPQVLEETGLLGADVLAVHCIDLTDEDLDILQRARVNIAHTPMTNSLGGNGVARVPEMLQRGMNVTLGHDCFFTLDTMDMAWGNGARALGLGKQIGSLAAGKKADIVIVKPDSPTPMIPASVQSWFTMTFLGKDVDTVLVDGQVVVQDRKMTTVNEEEVAGACVEQAKVLWRKTGVKV
jgi:5-methylthioadenosine/S-adenosylhomocysteine deaminase